MKNKKGASELIGFLTITLIAILIISATFFWAVKLIEQNQKFSNVQYSEELSIKISEAVERVVEQKTQQNIRIELNQGQIMYVQNESVVLSNTNAFSDEGLSGINYIRGSKTLCESANVPPI